MTGMDVLRQCRRYDEDVRRLELKRQMAMDAATRVTAGMSEGGGRSCDVSDKAGRYAVASSMIDQALKARKVMYSMEILCAGELFNRLPIDMAEVMNSRMLMGLTTRQTAAEIQRSESAVRSLYARAREQLESVPAYLSRVNAYREAAQRYCENGGAQYERFVKMFGTDEHK